MSTRRRLARLMARFRRRTVKLSVDANPIELIRRHPTVIEFNGLRASVGWPDLDPEVVDRAVQGGYFSVLAQVDGTIAGMARVISDGGYYFYIQDVIVRPEYQGRGIAALLMSSVMEEVNRLTPKGAYIALFAAPGLQVFYSRYGFLERPRKDLGPGMVFLKPSTQ